MKIRLPWRRKTYEERLKPIDAVAKGEIVTPGLYQCTGCGWAFRYLGQGVWKGPYWKKTHEWETAVDSRGEWAGYSTCEKSTRDLFEGDADCFGRLKWIEPVLQRRWVL